MGSQRDKWARLICRSDSAGRYLFPGNDLELAAARDDDSFVDLREFISRLEDRDTSTELLASAYWLTQPEVKDFVFSDLPKLLRGLGHQARTSPPKNEAAVRGKVFWPETLLGRYSGLVPRGRYLASRLEKTADIPENQLLKLFLTRLVDVANALAERGKGALPDQFARIREAASKALSAAYLHGIKTEKRLTARMLNTAYRHRNKSYSSLARLALDLDTSVLRGKWAQIMALLSKGWLAPISSDDLFELYALICVMDTLQGDLGFGPPVSYGLIQRGRAAVARYYDSERSLSADVFFDQVPSRTLGCASRYIETITNHEGVSGQERRPDLTVIFRSRRGACPVFLEVKETEDPSYIRESVYKAFGYLYDFATAWSQWPEQKPKVIVLFPTGVTPKDSCARELALVCLERGDDLATALHCAMDTLVTRRPQETDQSAA